MASGETRASIKVVILVTLGICHLLANIDIGWLQIPIYYAGALNKALIRDLPAFFPSQVSNIAAFSEFGLSRAVAGSLLYGAFLMLLALFIFWLRMRKR